MDNLQIVFGVISSTGVIVTIYFHIKNKKKKGAENQFNFAGNAIGTQTIQQADKIINNIVKEDKTKPSPSNRIDLKSDKEIRDYINNEMKNMPLIEVSFNQLAKKFIDVSIDWVIQIEKIAKKDAGYCKVYFVSDQTSRVEYFIINPDDFPILKFATKDCKFRIEAKIKEFDETNLVLDRVTNLRKL